MKACSLHADNMQTNSEQPMSRLALCKSLVKSGVRTVRDGADHSKKVNRCIVEGGKCVGYYVVLIDYDETTDTFCIGWKQRVPAAQVDEIALFDAISQIITLVQSMESALPPNTRKKTK